MLLSVSQVFEYPYTECLSSLSRLVDRCGCEQLHWGTDMPFQNRFCTYQQSRTYLQRLAGGLLTEQQLGQIFGGTAMRLLGVPELESKSESPGSDDTLCDGDNRRAVAADVGGGGRSASL